MDVVSPAGQSDVRRQHQDLLIERSRIALWVLLVGNAMFALVDLVLSPHVLWELWVVKAAGISLLAASLRLLRMPRFRASATWVAAASTSLGYAIAAVSGVIIDEVGLTLILSGVIALGLGASMPWGVAMQSLHVAAGMTAIVVNATAVPGGESVVFGYQGAAVAVLFAASVYVAGESKRSTQVQAEAMVGVREAQERTATLLAIARDVSGTLDRQQILDRVSRRAHASLSCDAVAIFFWDEERKHYRLLSQHGLSNDLVAAIATLEVGTEAPLVRHLQEHTTVVLDAATASEPVPRDLFDRFGIDTVAATPLTVGTRGLGAVLAFRSRKRAPFSPKKLELLEAIARHVAIAVEVAELHDSVKREGEVAAALAAAGRELIGSIDPPELMRRLCRLAVETLPCDSSCTFVYDAREGVYTPTARYGVSDEVWEMLCLLRIPAESVAPVIPWFEKKEVVELSNDDLSGTDWSRLASSYDLTRTLYVGLWRGDSLIGYQVAYRFHDDRAFDRQQGEILRGLGNLASLALERAFLVTELERANNVKSEFVATMSHELRTPLNAIIGYNALMGDGEFGPLTAEQADVCETINRSSRALLELISSTLDFSRLNAGQISLSLSDVSVAGLVKALRQEIDPPWSADVRVEWVVDGVGPMLVTDALKLKMIVKNLVENAVKFTDRGFVRVSARGTHDGVEIVVADTGIGIAHPAQALIFEPFKQLDGSSTRRHGGVGLGLYIVRRLVDALGGSISLESEPGRGSTFRVLIPSQATSRMRERVGALREVSA